MIGWQWDQLDHMQIICTSFQTDNHASISPLSFYRPDALHATQPTIVVVVVVASGATEPVTERDNTVQSRQQREKRHEDLREET